MSHKMKQLAAALLEIEKLRAVERKTYTVQGARRRENSAEHSWHLAMACWMLAENFAVEVDMAKLLKMALIHDLGEIDGGDTFLYAADRDMAASREAECIARLGRDYPALPKALEPLWQTQEAGRCTESQLLKAADRLLPFLLNLHHEGYPWREHGIRRSQVVAALEFIGESFPSMHQWMLTEIDNAVACGWLVAD